MDKLQIFIMIFVTLRSVHGGVRRHTTERVTTESDDVFLENLQKQAGELSSTYNQQFNQIFGSGGNQLEKIPLDSNDVTNMMQYLRNNQSSNIDLTQAMQYLNASHNLPFKASDSRANLTDSEFLDSVNEQVSSFSKIVDTDLVQSLKPENVQGYLNILRNMSDPSIANGENKAAREHLQDQTKALDAHYYRAVADALEHKETSPSEVAGSTPSLSELQKHITELTKNYNRELNQALRPDVIRNINLQELANNMGQALITVFHEIEQSPINKQN